MKANAWVQNCDEANPNGKRDRRLDSIPSLAPPSRQRRDSKYNVPKMNNLSSSGDIFK